MITAHTHYNTTVAATTPTSTAHTPTAPPPAFPAAPEVVVAGPVAVTIPPPETLPLAVAMKLFHAAILADGYTYVLCVVPDPTYIWSCPGRTVSANVAFSPPKMVGAPLEFVTRPVVFEPNTNSRRKTNA